MKEICLVAAYTPDLERQNVLRELVYDLKNNDKKVLLVTHSETPQDILKMVDYHFYDSENEFLTDNKYKVWYASQMNSEITVVSQDVIKYSAAVLPCTRNLWFGLSIAKSLGYDCAHYIEYDSKIIDISIIDENTKLLEEFDGVYYTDDATWQIRLPEQQSGGTHLYGAYSVYNLNSYSFDDLKWDRDLILDEYTKSENSQLVERVTEKLLIKGKKFVVKDKNILLEAGLKPNLLNKGGSNSKAIDPKILYVDEGLLKIYALNKSDGPERVELIINHDQLVSFTIDLPHFFINKVLAPIEDVKHIKIFNNNEFVREYTLETEDDVNNLIKYNHIRKI
jgi:hypothetical protein